MSTITTVAHTPNWISSAWLRHDCSPAAITNYIDYLCAGGPLLLPFFGSLDHVCPYFGPNTCCRPQFAASNSAACQSYSRWLSCWQPIFAQNREVGARSQGLGKCTTFSTWPNSWPQKCSYPSLASSRRSLSWQIVIDPHNYIKINQKSSNGRKVLEKMVKIREAQGIIWNREI